MKIYARQQHKTISVTENYHWHPQSAVSRVNVSLHLVIHRFATVKNAKVSTAVVHCTQLVLFIDIISSAIYDYQRWNKLKYRSQHKPKTPQTGKKFNVEKQFVDKFLK